MGVGEGHTAVLLVDRRGIRGDRVVALVGLVVLIVLIVTAADTRAVGLTVYRSPAETALAMDRSVFSLVFETAPNGTHANSWRVRAGERRLYDDAGLETTVCGAEYRRRDWGLGVTAAMVSSPVGDEAALAGTILAPLSGQVRLAGDVRFQRIAFDEFERAALVCVSLHVLLRISSRVALCPGVEDVRVAGEALPGADASLRAALFAEGPLAAVAAMTVSRRGELQLGVSSRLRLGRRAFLAVGYEDATGTLAGSLSLEYRSLGLDAGASVHPVLGVSEALFVWWRR